jgi:hypothetical protein
MSKIAQYTKSLMLRFTPKQYLILQNKAKELETSIPEIIRRLLKFIDKV